jgi:exopolysaccharide production protein ExoZ
VKFRTIQAARAVAANMVMLSHLLTVERKDGHGFTFLPDWAHLGACGVDIFFVVSGFIMATTSVRETWGRFLVARATRIFPLYWVYSGVVLMVAFVAPGIVNTSFHHQPSVWRSLLLVPDTVDPLLAVGWTLTHEAYFYLVFTALLFLGSVRLGGLCVWAAGIFITRGLMSVLPTQETSPVLAVILNPLTFEFIGGACVGLAIGNEMSRGAKLAFIVGCAALIAVCVSTGSSSALDAAQWQRVFRFGFPFMFMLYGLAASEKIYGAKHVPEFAIRIGDASYSLYLTHVLVLSAIGRCFALLPVHNIGAEVLFVALCIVGTNGIGLLSYRWVEFPVLRMLRGFRNAPGHSTQTEGIGC